MAESFTDRRCRHEQDRLAPFEPWRKNKQQTEEEKSVEIEATVFSIVVNQRKHFPLLEGFCNHKCGIQFFCDIFFLSTTDTCSLEHSSACPTCLIRCVLKLQILPTVWRGSNRKTTQVRFTKAFPQGFLVAQALRIFGPFWIVYCWLVWKGNHIDVSFMHMFSFLPYSCFCFRIWHEFQFATPTDRHKIRSAKQLRFSAVLHSGIIVV